MADIQGNNIYLNEIISDMYTALSDGTTNLKKTCEN